MLGLFPTLQSRINYFSQSNPSKALRLWFNRLPFFIKSHWPRLLIALLSLRCIPTMISTIETWSALISMGVRGWRPETRNEWAAVKYMGVSFAIFVVDPLISLFFAAVARPNPSNLPPPPATLSNSTEKGLNLVLDTTVPTSTLSSTSASTTTPASVTSPFIFKFGQVLFYKWRTVSCFLLGSDLWAVVSKEPFLDIAKLFFYLAGFDSSVAIPESQVEAWSWWVEGLAWVEILAYGYALWTLLRDLRGVKRDGWISKIKQDQESA